jgi:hypothetical protein
MTIKRAIEILNPEHRKLYDSIEPVNEAYILGMKTLDNQLWYDSKRVLPKDKRLVLCYTSIGFEIMSYRSEQRDWESSTTYRHYIRDFVKYWKELPDKPNEEREGYNIHD